MASSARYLALVTSEHIKQPNYADTITVSTKGFVDIISTLNNSSKAFDIDVAVGAQLDVVGEWVGASRQLTAALTGVYFSLDDLDLGLDQGSLQGRYDPSTGLVALPDDSYRILLYARILANQWDGTTDGIYNVWETMLSNEPDPPVLLIQDNGNMSIIYALLGGSISAIFKDLFFSGKLLVKPEAVRIAGYMIQPIPDTPYFGLDCENSSISGLDVGAFGIYVAA